MLSDAIVHATLPCSDFDRAKRFYAEKLGLTPSEDNPAGAFYDAGKGTRFFLFPSGGRASGTHTQVGFRVDDIQSEVRDLKARGVQFEEYDFPAFDKTTSVAQTGDIRSAWFKDSEGNLLGLVQLP
ncbi:MAG: VOC family protein [Candidatus Dormibacteraeota bacterium]|nr:VOC family protein [Candidatus Dormibacteraeota bacterium]